jgi:Ni,Fe-hydrogenase III component G
LRNRERGIRDLGVERVGLLDKRRILFIPSGIPIHLRKGITIPLNNIQPNKGIAIM